VKNFRYCIFIGFLPNSGVPPSLSFLSEFIIIVNRKKLININNFHIAVSPSTVSIILIIF
ncbi:unnamed protein product, partial [Strongylus vulgaris]